MPRDSLPELDTPPQCPGLLSPSEVRRRRAYHAAVRLMGAKGEDTHAHVATLGEVMGIEAGRVPALGHRVQSEAER